MIKVWIHERKQEINNLIHIGCTQLEFTGNQLKYLSTSISPIITLYNNYIILFFRNIAILILYWSKLRVFWMMNCCALRGFPMWMRANFQTWRGYRKIFWRESTFVNVKLRKWNVKFPWPTQRRGRRLFHPFRVLKWGMIMLLNNLISDK